jgi:hypothetical protein
MEMSITISEENEIYTYVHCMLPIRNFLTSMTLKDLCVTGTFRVTILNDTILNLILN